MRRTRFERIATAAAAWASIVTVSGWMLGIRGAWSVAGTLAGACLGALLACSTR